MRLYYSFVTGISGYLGVEFYEFMSVKLNVIENIPTINKKTVIISLLFLSWGINQIINDYLGLKEDKINAPNRPMVTGELNKNKALWLSIFLLLVTCCITWLYLEKLAVIPLILGVLLNIAYEFAKAYGVWGNIVFGLTIAQTSVWGFLASGNITANYFTLTTISLFLLIVIINAVMTFYTYFKDYEGDKNAGKNTLVVKYGINKSRYISLIFSIIPSLSFLLIYKYLISDIELNTNFIILALIATLIQIWTGFLYFFKPIGDATYYSLSVNFRACVCSQAAIIALFNPSLGVLLFLLSYIFIEFLFKLYSNSKA